MNTPVLKARIRELHGQVKPYSGTPETVPFSFSLKDPKKFYIGIPIVVFLLLIVFQPNFVKKEVKNQMKLCVLKLFLSWILISALLIIGLYASNFNPV